MKIILNNTLEPVALKTKEVPLHNTQVIAQTYEHALSLPKTHPNTLISMLYCAYAKHMPVKLRPDDLWIQILCQFGLHVNNKSNFYEKIFADKESPDTNTKTELVVYMGDISLDEIQPSDLDKFVNRITTQLEKHVAHSDIIENFQCDFSTSNQITKITSKIALMHMVEKYFSYSMLFGCGIPFIELDGTADDWINFHKKIKLIASIADDSIQEWCEAIVDISNRISLTFINPSSEDTITFWKRMFYNERCGSGHQECAQGWIVNLFIYDQKLKMLQQKYDPLGRNKKNIQTDPIFWDKFPECMVTIDVDIKNDGTCKLASGMCGYHINQNNSNTLELIMGFYFQRKKFSKWTLNGQNVQPRDEIFNQDNYSSIRYNNKMIHEYCPVSAKQYSGKIQKSVNPNHLRIYYTRDVFNFVYMPKKEGDGVNFLRCMFINGAIKPIDSDNMGKFSISYANPSYATGGTLIYDSLTQK